MDDGVAIAYDALRAGRAPPAGGWPGVMLFHGLGGDRQSMAPIAQALRRARLRRARVRPPRPRAVRRPLRRSTGRETSRRRRDPLRLARGAARGERPRSARWGISLGGGAVWNGARRRRRRSRRPRSSRRGPTSTTRSSPQGLPKSGAIFQFLERGAALAQAPELIAVERRVATHRHPRAQARSRRRARRVSRSARSRRRRYIFQGRQRLRVRRSTRALAGYGRLNGPKRLYVGDFGHAPSTFPGPDIELRDAAGARLVRPLPQGVPNGIETAPKVELAPESGGTPVGSASLPRTVTRSLSAAADADVRLGAARSCAALGSRARLETFGAPTVDVQAASRPAGRTSSPCSSRERPRARRSSSARAAPRRARLEAAPRPHPADRDGEEDPGGLAARADARGDVDRAEPGEPPLPGPASRACEDHRPERVAHASRPPQRRLG